MKSFLIVTAMVCVFGCNTFAAESTTASKKNVDKEISGLKQSIVELNVQNYKHAAEDFLKSAKSASANGQAELAKAYKNCSDASNKIAEGYKVGKQKMIDVGTEALIDSKVAVKKYKKDLNIKVDDSKVKYQSIISSYKKTADTYSDKAKQALKAGKNDLYTIYSSCADAKNKIASGLDKVLNGKEQYRKAVNTYNEFASAQNKMKMDDGQMPKKGTQLNAMASNLLTDMQVYAAKAVQAEKNGNAQLALACTQISGAKSTEASGLTTIADGEGEFKRASEKLKKNSDVQSKEETASSSAER
jgi:hypothetical protein